MKAPTPPVIRNGLRKFTPPPPPAPPASPLTTTTTEPSPRVSKLPIHVGNVKKPWISHCILEKTGSLADGLTPARNVAGDNVEVVAGMKMSFNLVIQIAQYF